MTKRSARRVALGALTAVALAFGTLAAGLLPAPPAKAANAALFNPGFIISDQVFYDAGAITAETAQSVIAAKGSRCTNNGSLPCLKNLTVNSPGVAASAQCAAVPARNGINAGTVFAMVGAACNVNPQVLITLVEKEQGLVSASTPSSWMYNEAAGFACPDTAPCSENFSGFFNQIYAAARQFQLYRQFPGSFNYQAGRVNNIQYSPNAACGTQAVYIQNQATAGLYDYTPYVPNSAALQNLNGIGDGCSSYGNRNFWRIFSDWFGNPTGDPLNCPSFNGCNAGWEFDSSISRAFNNDPASHSGSGDLVTVASTWNTSFQQTVNRDVSVGDTYQATAWVKTRDVGSTVSGTLAVWGLGGSGNENATTDFTVGNDWTMVTVQFQAAMRSHSSLRVEVYLKTTGHHYVFDDFSLSLLPTQPSKAAPPVSSPSFENGMGNWAGSDANRVIYSGSGAQDGTALLATNLLKAGGSIFQDVSWPVGVATSYTASIWVRAASGGSYSGTLALWGIGGSGNTGTYTPFVATNDWTKVQVTMPVTAAGQGQLRVQVYEYTAAPITLYVDNMSLTANLYSNGSFEAGGANWQPNESGTNLAVYAASQIAGTIEDGTHVGATNAAASNNSIVTDLPRSLQPGQSYTASIWLRANVPGTTFKGTLALWEIGPSGNANSNVAVSVGDNWQQYTVTRKIALSGGSMLRLQLYEQTTGVTVLVDGAVLN